MTRASSKLQQTNRPAPGTRAHHALARRIALTLGFTSACGPFATDMYLPAFPAIAADLGTTLGNVQITLAVYLFGLAVGQILWGTLCDHVGRRGPMLAGVTLFTCAAAACAVTHSIHVMIAARFLMGIGGSAGVVISRAIVRDLFDGREASRFFALIMIVGGIGPIVAPFAGSLLLTHLTWRAVFWTIFAFGIVSVLTLMRNIPETLAPESRMHGHFMGVFRGYGRILVNPRFIGPAMALGCTSGMLFTYISNSSFIFLELFGVPVAYFGFLFATNSIGLYAAGQSNRWLVRRFTPEQLLVAALWVNISASLLLIACAATGAGGFPALFGILFVCLSTLGIIFPNATVIVMHPFPAEAGFASALLGVIQFAIAALGGALVGMTQNGTALPMAIQIAALGVIAKLCLKMSPSLKS
ncbi:multidrug effflux MFS transporter [bacterium]|nr:multidrug effflux MFS transporter [bacterium]